MITTAATASVYRVRAVCLAQCRVLRKVHFEVLSWRQRRE